MESSPDSARLLPEVLGALSTSGFLTVSAVVGKEGYNSLDSLSSCYKLRDTVRVLLFTFLVMVTPPSSILL